MSLLKKQNTPISGKLIQDWLPDATILRYYELSNYNNLPNLPIVLLYEIKPQYGHWVSILRTPEGIEHFDSYGYAPDLELNFIPEHFKKVSKQLETKLLKLLYKTNDQINYNPYQLQKGLKSATCGRWVILRNLFNYLTIDQFNNMINNVSKELKITTDELVTLATQ